MLDELEFAVKHFVPTVPEEVTKDALEKIEEFRSNPESNELEIKRAFHEIGKQEFPHRRAYKELTSSSAAAQLQEMVLEHVDDSVKDVIKPHLDSGVSIEEFVRSNMFVEQLDAKQRYQIEDGILVAQSKLAESLKGEVSEHGAEYKKLYEGWVSKMNEIDAQIEKLESLSEGGDENQRAEIKNKAERFREGFLLTERDPELEEVKKEIEYWMDTFAEAE